MKIIHLVLGKANPLRMNGVNKLVHEMATTQQEMGYNVNLWGITENPIHDYPPRNYRTVLFPSLFQQNEFRYFHQKINIRFEQRSCISYSWEFHS